MSPIGKLTSEFVEITKHMRTKKGADKESKQGQTIQGDGKEANSNAEVKKGDKTGKGNTHIHQQISTKERPGEETGKAKGKHQTRQHNMKNQNSQKRKSKEPSGEETGKSKHSNPEAQQK